MAFEAKILADSVNPYGCRLVTFQCTYERFIHSELMTHREFSRNAASSRAIPIEKMLQRVQDDPVVPIHWGKNQKGMQAEEELGKEAQAYCTSTWLQARDSALSRVRELNEGGVHKQIANRLLEPFSWITTIISTTSFEHFRRLRCHKDAEPHFQRLAYAMADLYDTHVPTELREGEWHLPLTGFTGDGELTSAQKIMVSVARCARVSYLTHDGKRDVSADITLYERLASSKHWSPFEHAAMATGNQARYGNFNGFRQARMGFAGQHIDQPLYQGIVN